MINGVNTIRVMIVDDHPAMRLGLVALLSEQPGMAVVAEAADAETSVALFREHLPDVTLMDLRLPDSSGVEAIKTIRAEFPASRFIVLTTYDGDADISRALSAGAQGYLLKGMTNEELIRAINHVHQGRNYIPAAVKQRLSEQLPNSNLTNRETQVLELIVRGKNNREIAEQLAIKETTVKWFVKIIFMKLGVRDRAQAVGVALQRGLTHL